MSKHWREVSTPDKALLGISSCRDCGEVTAMAQSKRTGRFYLCQIAENKFAEPWNPHSKFCAARE